MAPVVLEMPFERALSIVAVPEIVKEALLGKETDFLKILNFVLLYERADWTELSRLALLSEIAVSDVFKAYKDALLWYSRLINMKVDEN